MSATELKSRPVEVAGEVDPIEFCYAQGWTDGLPVVPPTEARIAAFLARSGRAPDEVVGLNAVRRRTITAEKVAINAGMAGWWREYARVVMAAVEAMTAGPFYLHGPAASLAGSAILCIVNGPVVRELGFNSGSSVFGPGWRANSTVGRSIRLVLMNCLGAIPAVLDKSCFGHPRKFSYCMAEEEGENPWPPLPLGPRLRPAHRPATVCAPTVPAPRHHPR